MTPLVGIVAYATPPTASSPTTAAAPMVRRRVTLLLMMLLRSEPAIPARVGRSFCGADGAGTPHDELAALHEQHHRLGDLVLADRDDVVEPPLHEAERQLAGPLDRDPVGDRQRGRDGDRLAAHERIGERRARAGLDAD